MALTQARLKKLLEFNADTGIFYRKMSASRRHPSPWLKQCRTKTVKGYVSVFVDGKKYAAHRLAWLWMTGKLPLDQVDHIDANKSNNAWDNLREATNAQNQANTGPRKNNRVGLKGAHYQSQMNCWTARITVNGKRHFLGLFDEPEAAHAAYCDAVKRLNPEFGRVA